jgi:hypothetical protein
MVTGMVVPGKARISEFKDENNKPITNEGEILNHTISIAHKARAAFTHTELCIAGTNKPKSWNLYDYLFGGMLAGTGKVFPHGTFDLIDEKNPNLKNTISVDKTSNQDLITKNLKNKRELYKSFFDGISSD